MQKEGKNVYIFPISINYERLFEVRNIADAMVSKDKSNFGFLDIYKKINVHKGHKLGRCYVKFGETISLRDYFASSSFGMLSSVNINEAALSLTEKLVVENHQNEPVFLNMVVASLLLICDADVYPIKDLV